jgi:hypothetical protein
VTEEHHKQTQIEGGDYAQRMFTQDYGQPSAEGLFAGIFGGGMVFEGEEEESQPIRNAYHISRLRQNNLEVSPVSNFDNVCRYEELFGDDAKSIGQARRVSGYKKNQSVLEGYGQYSQTTY